MLLPLIITLLLLAAGCTLSVTDRIEMSDFLGRPNGCGTSVVNEQPNSVLIFSTQISDSIYYIVPSLQNIIAFKLCQNEKFRQYFEKNSDVKIYLQDVRTDATMLWPGYDVVLNYTGYLKKDRESVTINIQTSNKLFGSLSANNLKPVIDQSTDDFILKLEGPLRKLESK